MQLTTVRSLGLFLVDPLEVPGVVLDYLAGQLEITDASAWLATWSVARRFEHAEEIKSPASCGISRWSRGSLRNGWMRGRGRRVMGPRAIFNDAIGWLLERGVLLPGVTTLARLVERVREEATERLWDISARERRIAWKVPIPPSWAISAARRSPARRRG